MASMRLTFVGTGVSCAVPVIGHVDLDNLHAHGATSSVSPPPPPTSPLCSCTDAVLHPDGPNRRNNASLLISLFSSAPPSASSGEVVAEDAYVLIDAGKTFRDAYFRVLAPLRVPRVDVLVLTHGHADAMHCVEEVCDWQTARRQQNRDVSCRATPTSLPFWLPTFLTRKTLSEVESVSVELVQRSKWVHTTGNKPSLPPSQLDETEKHNVSEEEEDIECALAMYELCDSKIERIRLGRLLPLSTTPSHGSAGPVTIPTTLVTSPLAPTHTINAVGDNDDAEPDALPFFSFPVEHGAGYMSMCFAFGHGVAFRSLSETTLDKDDEAVAEKTCVVYISDVSSIPAASMQFLQDLVKIDVLVFDLLAEKGSHSPSHTCWDDVMPYIRALTPRKTYCVGMFCSLEHTEANLEWERDLREEKSKVRALLEQTGTPTVLDKCDRARCEAFLSRVESIELAYDGLQLVLPL